MRFSTGPRARDRIRWAGLLAWAALRGRLVYLEASNALGSVRVIGLVVE